MLHPSYRTPAWAAVSAAQGQPPGHPLGEQSLLRETAPVWGTYLVLFVLVVPAAAWVVWRELRQGR